MRARILDRYRPPETPEERQRKIEGFRRCQKDYPEAAQLITQLGDQFGKLASVEVINSEGERVL